MKKILILTLVLLFMGGTAVFSHPDPHQSKFYGQKMSRSQRPTSPKFTPEKRSGNRKPNLWDKYKKRK